MADETVFRFVFEDGGGDEPQGGGAGKGGQSSTNPRGSEPQQSSEIARATREQAKAAREHANRLAEESASLKRSIVHWTDKGWSDPELGRFMTEFRIKNQKLLNSSSSKNYLEYIGRARSEAEEAGFGGDQLDEVMKWAIERGKQGQQDFASARRESKRVAFDAMEAAKKASELEDDTSENETKGPTKGPKSLGALMSMLTSKFWQVGLAVSAFSTAIALTERNLARMTQALEPYSAAIQGAEARAENRQIVNDIRQAQIYGPDLARYVSARSELEVAVGNIANALGGGALDQFLPLLEAIAVAANKITDNDGFRKSISENLGILINSTLDRFQLRKLIPAILDLLGATEAIKKELASNENILDIFDNSPDLTVDFGGKTYGTKGGLQVNGGAQFRNPPPVLNLI